MGIRVGTIVKPYVEDYAGLNGYFPCERYNQEHPDIPHFLQNCVGIVLDTLDAVDGMVTVQWVSMCRYHHNYGEPVQRLDKIDELWEIGQMQ